MKPTIFFSHSSKDKESLIILKSLIEEKTGGTINIFMSSDGQSIPFGSNWMHKIEEGLKNARIMFVFVTPKSIDTGWIYFEAGYAYSKGIDVIPIGINIDIGSIKPPISLLQGFNMISEESINNIIHIINKKFDYNFRISFSEEEFKKITYKNGFNNHLILGEEVIDSISTSIFDYQGGNSEVKVNYEKAFELIENKLIQNDIEYCIDNNNCILINGLKIYKNQKENRISFKMDLIGFFNNFTLVNEMINNSYINYNGKNPHYIEVQVKNKYELLKDDIKISSKIANNSIFSINRDKIGFFNYKQYKFIIEEDKRNEIFAGNKRIRVVYPTDNYNIGEILELISELSNMEIIKSK